MYGEMIRELRKSKGWTTGELAAKIGFKSHSDIGMIEREERELSLKDLVKTAKLFNVSTDYILGYDADLENNMNNDDLHKYHGLLCKTEEERNSTVTQMIKEIEKLCVEIDKQNSRDLVKEVYEKCGAAEKGISLKEFIVNLKLRENNLYK